MENCTQKQVQSEFLFFTVAPCLWYFRIYVTYICYAKSLQSYPTLYDPIDGSPPGSAISGILQARILEWVAISVSKEWNWKVKVKSLSHVWLLATPRTVAYQAPPSLGFARKSTGVGCIYIKPHIFLFPSPLFSTTTHSIFVPYVILYSYPVSFPHYLFS